METWSMEALADKNRVGQVLKLNTVHVVTVKLDSFSQEAGKSGEQASR